MPGIPKSDSHLPPGYLEMVRQIRKLVHRHVPRGCTLLVASKGDPALLKFSRRGGWHFPRNAEGKYAGYYPAGSTAAIAHLEALRVQGGKYFVLPASSFWWLDYYRAFQQHLNQRYRLVARDESCLIYALRRPAAAGASTLAAQLGGLVSEFETRFGREPVVLDCQSGLGLRETFPQLTIFSPPSGNGALPYLDHSIDIVAVNSSDAAVAGEARRVAMAAVATSKPAAKGQSPTLAWEWLVNSGRPKLPSASIIIRCRDGGAWTDGCIESLTQTLPEGFSVEIIAVEDGSSARIAGVLKRWARKDPRLKVLPNRRNPGWAQALNRGAARSRGELLIFLDNDMVLLPGWLPPLLRVFSDFPRAGAVGGKVISPEGTLQEAGGLVFADGSRMSFGHAEPDPDGLLYSFVREVDYCCGALLATRRRLFQKMGGFDPGYGPGAYTTADYCFRMRAKGYRVYFQPESAAVRHERDSAGREEVAAKNGALAAILQKFTRRWESLLQGQPARPGKVDAGIFHALAMNGTPWVREVNRL